MKIDFSATLKGFDGEPIKDGEGNTVTLGSAVVIALTAPQAEDSRMSGDEKFKRDELARVAWQSEKNKQPAELPVEDVAIIKSAVGQGWSTLVVWSAFRLIEGAA